MAIPGPETSFFLPMAIPGPKYSRVDQLNNTWVFEASAGSRKTGFRTVYILEDDNHSALAIGPYFIGNQEEEEEAHEEIPPVIADPVITVKYLCHSECDKTAKKTLELISTLPPFTPSFQFHAFNHKSRACGGLARLLVKDRPATAEQTATIQLANGSVFKPNSYTRNFLYLFVIKETFDIALCADKDNDIIALQTVLEDFSARLKTHSCVMVAEQWNDFANKQKPGEPLYNFATFAAVAFNSLSPRIRKERIMVLGLDTFMRICSISSSQSQLHPPPATPSPTPPIPTLINILASLKKSPALLRVPFFMGMSKLGEYTKRDLWIDDSRAKELGNFDNPDRLLWVYHMLSSIVWRIEVGVQRREVEILKMAAVDRAVDRAGVQDRLKHIEMYRMVLLENLRELDDLKIELVREL